MIDVLVVGGIFREVVAADTEPEERLGGSGLTAATAAAALGAEVLLAGAVGADDADELRDLLEVFGVRASLSVTAGRSGTFAYPTRQSADQPWPLYRPAEGPVVDQPQLPDARVLVLFGIPDFDPVAAGWLDEVSRGAIVLWDRQGWLSRARDDAHVLALDTARRIYVANESEAVADTGADLDWTLHHLPAPGYSAALIKRGVDGVLVLQEEGSDPTEVPAFLVNATTAIGSGDAFAGAVAASLARRDELTKAARIGCAVAAALIERGHNLVDKGSADRACELLSSR